MPFRIDDHAPEVRIHPQDVGAQTDRYLDAWGVTAAEKDDLFNQGAVAGPR